jgi:homocysteine S-methyltransferase
MTQDNARLLTSGKPFLTFGGTETYLLFQQRYPLREFCAFELAFDDDAWRDLEDGYLRPIADAAARSNMGLLADTLVWRASADYVERLQKPRGVAGVNRAAVDRLRGFVERWRTTSPMAAACPVVLSADLGPRGDGYAVSGAVTPAAASDYHRPQIEALAEAGVDVVAALTMTSAGEAIGIVRAAREAGLPTVVSPTLETDGRLPDGAKLADFVAQVDDATGGAPVCYQINCVHPIHVEPTLRAAAEAGATWLARVKGVRANASTKSHAELDNSTELDRGDPDDLAGRMAELRRTYGLAIVGGCCGTDAEHLRLIAERCA